MSLLNILNTSFNQSYKDDRDSFVAKYENDKLLNGDPTYFAPYYDGSIAMGYGFDLLKHSDSEIDSYFALAGLSMRLTQNDKTLLAAARVPNATNLSAIPAQLSLRFQTEIEARQLLSVTIDKETERYLDRRLGLDEGVAESKERIALISLAYQRGSVTRPLIGAKLIAAIQHDDRAEAWYEIRYNTSATFAPRHYAESAQFGLYDSSGGVSETLATSIYQMYTRHKSDIERYERQNPPTFSITHYLSAAREVLLQKYAQPYGIDVAVKDIQIGEDFGTAYVSTRPDAEHDDDTLIGTKRSDLLIGESGRDILVGYAGNDVLVGGNDNDVLYGMDDNDVLDGGAGDDTLYGGAGNDTLKGGEGRDDYMIAAGELAGSVKHISDSDNSGAIHILGQYAITGAGAEWQSPGYWLSDDGTQYRTEGQSLYIFPAGRSGTIVVENWTNGGLDIVLPDDPRRPRAPAPPVPPERPPPHLQAVRDHFEELKSFRRRDPIVLDLDGDGVETYAEAGRDGVRFDHDGDGVRTPTGWIAPDDGFLVLDRNGNGKIDNGAEIFGDSTPLDGGGVAANGIDALAALDVNKDNLVDANDPDFARLQVWRDLNSNGISEAGEIKSLADLGITGFTLTPRNYVWTELPDGNRLEGTFGFNKADGSTGTVGELWFRESNFYSEYVEPIIPTLARINSRKRNARSRHSVSTMITPALAA